MSKKAVILLSGGLDSSTCLAIAHSQGFDCYPLSFHYGQTLSAELNAAKKIAAEFGAIEHRIVELNIGQFGGSALTDDAIDVPDYTGDKTIPVTYVPARNTTFLSIALGFAEVIGAYDIFAGLCCVDYSGYPDCRPEYIAAFQTMANLATKTGVENKPIQLHTPLLYLSKAETIQQGIKLGLDYAKTVSCYQAEVNTGKACGRCDSCSLRRQGFIEAGITDPTRYTS